MDYALEKSSGFRSSFPDHVEVFDLVRVLIYRRLGWDAAHAEYEFVAILWRILFMIT
jgi:hypothetical protein